MAGAVQSVASSPFYHRVTLGASDTLAVPLGTLAHHASARRMCAVLITINTVYETPCLTITFGT
jgi:hypothetical protein